MCPKLRDWEVERVPKIDEIWMLACINNSMQNGWFWKPKFKKIVKKNDSKNHVFSACVFLLILERFGEGFGKVLGDFGSCLASLGAFLSLFFQGFFGKPYPF